MILKHASSSLKFSLVLMTVFLLTACGKTAPVSEEAMKAQVGKLPLSFQENKGQVDAVVKYLVKNGSTTVFFTPEEVVYNMVQRAPPPTEALDPKRKGPPSRAIPSEPAKGYVIRQSFTEANKTPELNGEEELPGKVNYMVGSDRTKWVKGLRTFASVHYAKLYPGIDLVYSGLASQLNYRYVVDAGADHKAIRVKLAGVEALSINGVGNLVMKQEFGETLLKKPMAYQEIAGKKKNVSAQYKVIDNTTYSFEIGSFDPAVPLVIETE